VLGASGLKWMLVGLFCVCIRSVDRAIAVVSGSMATSRKKPTALPRTPLQLAYDRDLLKLFKKIADDWGGDLASIKSEGPGFIVVRLRSINPDKRKGSAAEVDNGHAKLRFLYNNGISLVHVGCLQGRTPVWISPIASAVIAVMTR